MNRSTAREEAARWFLRLQQPAAKSESFLEWQRWLAQSPEHEQMFRGMENTVMRLADSGAKPALPSAEEMAADDYDGSVPIADFKRTPALPRRSGFRYAIAAGIAAVALVGGWLWLANIPSAQQGIFAYHTAPGERRSISLAEGSTVRLDADSVLNVTLTPDRRSLILIRGEAYFQVAKDAQRPFIVFAGDTQVRAVGTAFNIRMSQNRTVVAVTEGKVEVAPVPKMDATASSSRSDADLVRQLSAGQAVSYQRSGHIDALSEADAALATSWLQGRRRYVSEPLREVLADVSRYTGRHIELADELVGDIKFTGTLNLENSQAWLNGLSVAMPVQIDKQQDGSLSIRLKIARP